MLKFYTDQKAKEEIAQLNQRIEFLENEIQPLQEQVETLQEENKALAESNHDMKKEAEEISKELESLEAENDKLSNEIEAAGVKLDSFDEEVEKAAMAKFESLGGQPAPAAGQEILSDEEIKAKFNSMPAGAERTQFFRKHKNVLSL